MECARRAAIKASEINAGEKALDKPTTPAAAGKGFYVRSSLVALNTSAAEGCSNANWNCFSNLCKAKFGTNAWCGYAGCWSQGANWLCYFDCNSWQETQ
jgi:hypothetical protein